MIYDVKSEYYQTFLSAKQGSGGTKSKSVVVADSDQGNDVMDTED